MIPTYPNECKHGNQSGSEFCVLCLRQMCDNAILSLHHMTHERDRLLTQLKTVIDQRNEAFRRLDDQLKDARDRRDEEDMGA